MVYLFSTSGIHDAFTIEQLTVASRQWPVKSLGPQRLRWFKRSEGRGLGCGGRGRVGGICGVGEAGAREGGGGGGACGGGFAGVVLGAGGSAGPPRGLSLVVFF